MGKKFQDPPLDCSNKAGKGVQKMLVPQGDKTLNPPLILLSQGLSIRPKGKSLSTHEDGVKGMVASRWDSDV